MIRRDAKSLASFGETSEARSELVAAQAGDQIVAANLRPQPIGHQPQETIADRMAEGIVYVLEQIEVDTEHRHALVSALASLQRLAKPILIEFAVRQVGQTVMMRHKGDPRLGLAAFGDVDHRDQIAVAALEADAPPKRQHLNFAAVSLEMPPVAPGMKGLAGLLQGLAMADPFVLRPDLPKLHAQKGVPAVAVVLHRRVVDAEEAGGFGIEHPHRHRVVVEQQAKRGFATLQRRHIRNRQRENVAEGGRAELQVALIAVDFELIAVAAPDDAEQSLDHFGRAKQIAASAEPAPLQFR